MSAVPPPVERTQIARPDKDGRPSFSWTLTSSSITDTVRLIAGPFDVLPVVFVPGIMGSNLKTKDGGAHVWRLDTGFLDKPWGLVEATASLGPGPRQRLLHPDRCVVDSAGAVPSEPRGSVHSARMYTERGWGSVGQGSYHDFLMWLEEQLNPAVRNPARWTEYYHSDAITSVVAPAAVQTKLAPGERMGMLGQPFGAEKLPFVSILSDDLIARSKFLMPIYAVGYNWLASNRVAAAALQQRIFEIIRENDKGQYRCEQVILVTHSMGGLVARACAKLPGTGERIAGIVHGVIPALGAAAAYRRCKLGVSSESYGAGLVLGSTGQEVTAVFAQSPGTLQLLPTQSYSANWLRVTAPNGHVLDSWPKAAPGGDDPYSSIYLCRDRWWGLVNEAWLAPKEGVPINWEDFEKNIAEARQFHAVLGDAYHPNTYAFYGADSQQKSFEKVTWRVQPGLMPDHNTRVDIASIMSTGMKQVHMDGATPEYVGGMADFRVHHTSSDTRLTRGVSSFWELHGEMQDGGGDGTVPTSSGAAPLARSRDNVRQQFRLSGIEHEPAFRDGTARRATLYAITKIAGMAKRPQ